MLPLHSEYYKRMLNKGRLLPVMSKGKISGLISFYITNDDKPYIDANPYDVLEDNPEGSICYIAQAVSIGNIDKPLRIWSKLQEHIKDNFSNVRYIHWNRGKNGIMHSYVKQINHKEIGQCLS